MGDAQGSTTADVGGRPPGRRNAKQLVVIQWQDQVEVVFLEEGQRLTIGRGQQADICVEEPEMSRLHAALQCLGGTVWVEDLGSRNGVFLGDERVGRAALSAHVSIVLGSDVEIAALSASAPMREKTAADGDVHVLGTATRELDEELRSLARSTLPILILGETGVGKEVYARRAHGLSARSEEPFFAINCGALPSHLLESVLFGHERGAFTGADRQKPGLFEEASGGTVFLDEVGELSAAAQVALLRTLEEGTIVRVGSAREIPVDVRIIAATHRDLEAMVEERSFRRDLLFRLNVAALTIPPLRERRDEIPTLADLFLRRANETQRREIAGLSAEALARLRAHDWPGNVRELRNAIDRAVVLCKGNVLTPKDLPTWSTAQTDSAPSASSPQGLDAMLRSYEIELILRALVATGGNQTVAAKHLGISRRTLVEKIANYDLATRIDVECQRAQLPAFDADAGPLREQVAARQHDIVQESLQAHAGDPVAAAQDLDISRKRLRSILKRQATAKP